MENFANDTKAYRTISTMNDAQQLQTSIDKFSQWSMENDLEINANKCYIMTLACKRNPIKFKYTLHDWELSRVNHHKDPGVTMNSKLTIIPHIDKQTAKAKSMLALIKHFSNGLFTQDTMKTLYMSLVRSHLDYASFTYNPAYNVHINKLESVQKQYALYAFRHERSPDPYAMRPYIDRCRDLSLQTLARRRTGTLEYCLYTI